jgi:hypothetical protein
MATRSIEVTVKLTIRDDVDVSELVSEMDYSFTHGDDIVDTEVIDVNTEV